MSVNCSSIGRRSWPLLFAFAFVFVFLVVGMHPAWAGETGSCPSDSQTSVPTAGLQHSKVWCDSEPVSGDQSQEEPDSQEGSSDNSNEAVASNLSSSAHESNGAAASIEPSERIQSSSSEAPSTSTSAIADDVEPEISDEVVNTSTGVSYEESSDSLSEAKVASSLDGSSTKPKNVTALAGDGYVSLSWDSVLGASRYAVASQESDGSFKTYSYNCTTNSFSIGDLTNGIRKGFLVQSYVDGAWSLFETRDLVYATPHELNQPVAAARATGDGEVTLSWDAVPRAERYAIAEWKNERYHTFTTRCDSTSYIVSNLSNNTVHSFLVQAFVDGAWSRYSINQLVSATPTGSVKPSVTGQAGEKSANLSWFPVSGATQYAVAVQSGDGYKTYTYDFVGTSYSVHDLIGMASYKFLVQAKIDGKWSRFTAADLVCVTPFDSNQPSQVSANPSGDGQVTLSWNPVEGASAYAVAEYTNGSYRTFTTNETGTSYNISNLANGKSHSFLVQAKVNGAWSEFTTANLVSAIPVGTMKPSPTVNAVERGAILSWKDVPGSERYAIAYRFDGGTYTTITYDFSGTRFTASNLIGNVPYHFVVQAYVMGAWTNFSNSDVVSVTPIDDTQPQNVTVVSTGNGTVTLSWDKVAGATKYAVAEYYRGKYRTFTLDCASTTYTATDVANEMNHRFLVQAFVNGQWSSFGEMLCVNAEPHGTYKPNPKADGGYANITVRWNSVPGAVSYVISEYFGGNVYREIARGITGLEYTIWNLGGQTTHGYLVQAFIDAAGSYSSYSSADVSYATTTNPAIPQAELNMINAAKIYSSRSNYLIMVDRGNCKVGVFSGNRGNWSIKYYWDCTPGKPSTPTISGTYAISYRKPQLSTTAAAKWATNISGGYFFHSILNSTSELGHQLSHGCVRLVWDNARWIYDNIPNGTTVHIY